MVAPVISLNGDNPMELEVGSTYDEPGATAEDNVDGDVSDAIEVSGDVDTSTVGEYEVVYTVSDEAGNEATATRIVNIIEAPGQEDRKSTRLNSSHVAISYAVFCLKKKNKKLSMNEEKDT